MPCGTRATPPLRWRRWHTRHLALRDAIRDRSTLHGTADALCSEHGTDARHGALDARGADDDTLHGHLLFPRVGGAQLRHTAAETPGEHSTDCITAMDDYHFHHLRTTMGIVQIPVGKGMVCGAVLFCGSTDYQRPAPHTAILLGLRHRAGGRHPHCHE